MSSVVYCKTFILSVTTFSPELNFDDGIGESAFCISFTADGLLSLIGIKFY